MLHIIIQQFAKHPAPALKPAEHTQQAAVLIPIIKKMTPELVLTLRAHDLAVHPGEVAFPGGGYESEDQHLIQTALRETEEEIGITQQHIEIIGALNQQTSKHEIQVQPFVGLIDDQLDYTLNTAEVAAIFNVPLEFFLTTPPSYTHRIDSNNTPLYIPCYFYNDYKIWGLTAMMIVELTNIIYGLNRSLMEKPQGPIKIL